MTALAFPGAVGFGAVARGGAFAGATPTIYRVTNTNDSGAGSLRAACEASGRRIVVFTTGGTITLSTKIKIENPYITILGHTAPSDSGGITLKNGGHQGPSIKVAASEVIIRYIRCRPGTGSVAKAGGQRAISIASSSAISNIYLDHCDFSWGSDEVCTAYEGASDITIAYCTIAEALHRANHPEGYHGRGSIMGYKNGADITLYKCLFASNNDRNAMVKAGGLVEMVNCVIFNGKVKVDLNDNNCTGSDTPPSVNVINCHMREGIDSTGSNRRLVRINKKGTQSTEPTAYLEGNDTPWVGPTGNQQLAMETASRVYYTATKHTESANPITPDSAAVAYQDVIANVGCTVPTTDDVRDRIIAEVVDGSTRWIDDPSDVGGWPTLAAGTAWTDSDSDGLPNDFETENGGDTTSLVPTDDSGSGYLWIEVWGEQLISDATGTPTPSAMTTHTIAATIDDAYIDSETVDTESPSLYAGDYDADTYDSTICLRYTNIQIAQGYEVSEAYIDLAVLGVDGTTMSLTLSAEDVDSAAAESTRTELEAAIAARTTATVAWSPAPLAGQRITSPNIASVINEVTARAGWVPGADLRLFIEDSGSGWNSTQRLLRVASYDSTVAAAPTLRIGVASDTAGGTGATVNAQIATGADDGYVRQTTFDNTNTLLFAGDFDVTKYDYDIFLRWDGIAIPAGADIVSATVQLYAKQATDDWDLTISGEDADDPIAPTTAADWNGRTMTTATVNWTGLSTVSSEWLTSPDISTIIQEIVDRGGWATGQAMQIGIIDNGVGYDAGHGRIKFESYEGSTSEAAILEITWSTARPIIHREIAQPIGQGLGSGVSHV